MVHESETVTASINNNYEEAEKPLDKSKVVEGRNGLMVVDPENNPSIVKSVQLIREKFLEEYKANPTNYVEKDVQMISQCDYFIRRFLYPHDLDATPAYEQFKTWMAWRKESGFEDASEQRFPIEFYQIGACFRYPPDKDGALLMYMRFKVYRRLDILEIPIKQFVVYHMDRMDSQARKERGWGIIFDTRGAGLAQVDFDMLIFLFKTVKQYYPWGLRYVAVYELPWILTSGWKVVQKLLPEDATRLIRFYNKQNINEIVPTENLPDFMGGTCPIDYTTVPEGCKSSEEIAFKEFGFTPEQVQSVKKHFEKYLMEAQERKGA